MTVEELRRRLDEYDDGRQVALKIYSCGGESVFELEQHDIEEDEVGNVIIDASYN